MRDFLKIIMEAQAPKPGFSTAHRYPDGEVYHTEYDAPEEGDRVRERATGREGVMHGSEPSHHGEEYSPDCFIAWDDDQEEGCEPLVARTTLAEIEPLESASTSIPPVTEGRAGAFSRLLVLERLLKAAPEPVFKSKYHDVVPNFDKFDIINRKTKKIVGMGLTSTREAIASANLKDSRIDGEDVGVNLRNLEVAESEHHEVIPKGMKFDIRDRSSGRTVGMGYDSREAAEASATLKDRRKNGEDVGTNMRNLEMSETEDDVSESEHHEVIPKGMKFDIRDRSSGRTVGMGYDSEDAAEASATLKDRRKNGEDVGNGMRDFD